MRLRHLFTISASATAVVVAALGLPLNAVAASESGPASSAAAGTAVLGAAGAHTPFVELKLQSSAGMRLHGQRFVGPDLAAASELNQALSDADAHGIRRLITGNPAAMRRETEQLRGRGHAVPDLSQWYVLTLPSRAQASEVAVELSTLDAVAEAAMAPAPAPPPATADFEPMQGYRFPAPQGIGDTSVDAVAGADGSSVKVIDVEYSWNLQHEDLVAANPTLTGNGNPCDPFNSTDHGTAVLGVLAATDNASGVTGIVPDAQIGVTNASRMSGGFCSYDLANSIQVAAADLSPGDVILIEQQAYGVNDDFVPVEWVSSVYDSIKTATAQGIIVVEAAGNGSANLDAAAYGAPFPSGKPDSGAIIVGAGRACTSAQARSRASFSTYGSRVNVQGWGECVTTTGYGDLAGSTPNDYYTSTFNGTSSASPVVAGTAAAVLSAHELATSTTLTPHNVRSLLIATGTPQVTGPTLATGHIGPLPNLVTALANSTPPQTPAGMTAKGSNRGIKLTWSAASEPDLAGYNVYRSWSPSGATWKPIAELLPTRTGYLDRRAPAGVTSYYRLEAVDVNDLRSSPAATQEIRPGPNVVQQSAATFSGAWKTDFCACASGGSRRYSSVPGAPATYTFTGSKITLVSAWGSDRGAVVIRLDGTRRFDVSLTNDDELDAVGAWTKRFKTSGTHTVKIVVQDRGANLRVDVDAFVVAP